MKRLSALAYAVLCYLLFFGTFVYMVLFLGNFSGLLPKTVNTGGGVTWIQALAINLSLIGLIGLQHSVMARKTFKKWWTQYISWPFERSTYVLFSSLAIILLLWFWQPITEPVWEVEAAWASLILNWGFWLGWLILFLSTYMIDHFSLFGLKQAWSYWKGEELQPPKFMEPGFYKYVRHPLMLGFIIAFWSVPRMTVGHLIFSAGMTAYIFIGVYFEEKSMIRRFGEKYEDYRQRVPKIFPGIN